jgi:hypothetical protein
MFSRCAWLAVLGIGLAGCAPQKPAGMPLNELPPYTGTVGRLYVVLNLSLDLAHAPEDRRPGFVDEFRADFTAALRRCGLASDVVLKSPTIYDATVKRPIEADLRQRLQDAGAENLLWIEWGALTITATDGYGTFYNMRLDDATNGSELWQTGSGLRLSDEERKRPGLTAARAVTAQMLRGHLVTKPCDLSAAGRTTSPYRAASTLAEETASPADVAGAEEMRNSDGSGIM